MEKMRLDKSFRIRQFSAPGGFSGPSFGRFTEICVVAFYCFYKGEFGELDPLFICVFLQHCIFACCQFSTFSNNQTMQKCAFPCAFLHCLIFWKCWKFGKMQKCNFEEKRKWTRGSNWHKIARPRVYNNQVILSRHFVYDFAKLLSCWGTVLLGTWGPPLPTYGRAPFLHVDGRRLTDRCHCISISYNIRSPMDTHT